MNIYEDEGTEGILNLARARDELKGVGMIHDANIRRQSIAEISAAALVDIAASLRVVAADARLGLDDFAAEVVTAAEPEAEEPEDFLVVSDRVETPDGAIGTVLSFGMTEGSAYAEVAFDNGPTAKTWLENLSRVTSTETDDESGDDGYIAESSRVSDPETGEAPTHIELAVDDIDSDFDGDTHTAAASALDLLKANEAERKAKKKGTKK